MSVERPGSEWFSAAAEGRPPDPFQFGLRGLFAAVTLVAVVMAIAISFGEGALALSLGIGGIYLAVGGAVKRQRLPMYVGFALLALFVFLSPLLLTVAVWDGHRDVPLTFVVRDAATHEPIAVACIELSGAESPSEALAGRDIVARATGSADGTVVIQHTFWASGRTGLWTHTGHLHSSQKWVKVAADHYQVRVLLLDDLIGEYRDINSPPPGVIQVLLDASP